MDSFPASVVMPSDWPDIRAHLESIGHGPITLDALTGPNGHPGLQLQPVTDDSGAQAGWLIAQRRNGHRHSADDVLTAWFALQKMPAATEHLDLGTGIGTVGLLVLWGLGPTAKLTGIEAQSVSHSLWQANLSGNRLHDRVSCHFGDLRFLHLSEKFPLVTGSPPYFPSHTGVLPEDSQKAHARFELRGDVRDYAAAAKRHLAAEGRFVFCFPRPQHQRAIEAIAATGLILESSLVVVPRESLPPLFTVYSCRHSDIPHPCDGPTESTIIIRHADGKLSAAMATVRRSFGFADGPAHGGHYPPG